MKKIEVNSHFIDFASATTVEGGSIQLFQGASTYFSLQKLSDIIKDTPSLEKNAVVKFYLITEKKKWK
ncbi:hypothetical protein VBD025_04645 [Virgibacillus flavescens]|uniref:hypothetical protein n=1 Tax=Virgibacillus flavescens TaxID=1611422 RepID=UPI003D328F0B